MRGRQIPGLGRRKPKVIKFETMDAFEEWLIRRALLTQYEYPGGVNEHLMNVLVLRGWVDADTGNLTDFGFWELQQMDEFPEKRAPLHVYWNENKGFALLMAGFIATLIVIVALMALIGKWVM